MTTHRSLRVLCCATSDMEMSWVTLKEEARELDAAWAKIPISGSVPDAAAAVETW